MKNRQVNQPRSYVGKVWSERLVVDKGLETRVYRMSCPRPTSLRHCLAPMGSSQASVSSQESVTSEGSVRSA